MADELRDDWSRRWPPASYWVRTTVVIALTLWVLGAARSVLNILILVLVAAVLAVGLDRADLLLPHIQIAAREASLTGYQDRGQERDVVSRYERLRHRIGRGERAR